MTSTTIPASLAAAPVTETADELSFTIAIDDGPVTPDYDGASRGWRACLILDPEDRTVSLYRCIGSGTPVNVWHNRALTASINIAASGEAVAEILREHASAVEAIFDSYEGSEWDGHNHVGSWATDDQQMPTYTADLASLEAALEDAPTYWSAGDWLEGDWSGSKRELRKALAAGQTADEVAAAWVASGRSDGALLDHDDVAKQIARMVKEIEEEDADDEGDDEN